MIQINPLQSYIDGGARAAITSPPSASLVFDLPGKAIWVKGVKLKGIDHTYTFSHDNYITLTNTPGSDESEDILIGVNITLLKQAIDTTYTTGTLAQLTTGTDTTALVWTAKILAQYVAGVLPTTKKMKINGTDYSIYTTESSLPTFLAPTTLGTTGQILACTASGLTWVNQIQNTDYKVTQSSSSLNEDYRVILKLAANNDPETTFVRFSEYLTFNPSTKLLKINGLRVITLADVYVGATSSDDATAGLVPATTSAQRNYFLRGDGTWLTIVQENTWRPIKVGTIDALGSGTDTGTLTFVAGTGITLGWDATNKKITITNSAPDLNHNTDRTGIYKGAVSGTKKTDTTLIVANSSSGLIFEGGTNLFKIGDGTNYVEIPITPSFAIDNKAATIGTSLTTIATIAGVDITAKIGSYAASDHTHPLSIAGDSGTSSISLAASTKYKLTAGGSTYVFTSTPDENVKQTPKTDNVNRPLMMINGGTSAGELTSTSMFSTGIYANASTNMITANGFVKAGSDSSHVLLGDGDHKALSDFSMAHDHPYLPLAGGIMTGEIKLNMGGTYNGAYNTTYSSFTLWDSSPAANTRTNKFYIAKFGTNGLCLDISDLGGGTITQKFLYKNGTIALLSDIPTKSSWDYDDVYLKLSGGTMYGNILVRDDMTYNLGSSSKEWAHGYIREVNARHLDASGVYSNHLLYIGYGSSSPTNVIYFYLSSSTSARTLWAEINSSGLYALTRFGINGLNTSYNLYVNGTAYINGHTQINLNISLTGNSANIGFNREVTTGSFYVSNSAAYLFHTDSSTFNLLAYNGTYNNAYVFQYNSSTGRVGILKNSPSYNLDVNGNIGGTSLYLSNSTAIEFFAQGSGTYNRAGLYIDSDAVIFETHRASDSASAAVRPFYINTRGGLRADMRAGNINVYNATTYNITPASNYTYNLGNSTTEFVNGYVRLFACRHIDASAPFKGDYALYVGYGSASPTNVTYFYYSTSSARTLYAEVNSNGFKAHTRLGVNGLSTSYNLYISGTTFGTNSIGTNGSFYSYSTAPMIFYGSGSGTYDQAALYVSQSDGITFETPRASNSGSAAIRSFQIRTRGGQVAPLVCGSITCSLIQGDNTSNRAIFRHLDGLNCSGNYDLYLQYHVSGVIRCCLNVYAPNYYTTSDRSKKQNISSFSEHIRKFQLKDTEKWHYGVIAQEVPEMFRDGEEGNMTVNYNSVLSFYIGLLENRVKKLEDKLKKYEEIQNI